jgi:zona occludens toxin (predicted ATPase)
VVAPTPASAASPPSADAVTIGNGTALPAVTPASLPVALTPVPEDTCHQVTITNFNAFKQTMPLHPQYWSFIDKQ